MSNLIGYHFSKNASEKNVLLMNVIVELQRMSSASDHFTFTRSALKNILLAKNFSEGPLLSIIDKDISDRYYPAEVYQSVTEDPQYVMTIKKLKNAFLKSESQSGAALIIESAAHQKIMELIISP